MAVRSLRSWRRTIWQAASSTPRRARSSGARSFQTSSSGNRDHGRLGGLLCGATRCRRRARRARLRRAVTPPQENPILCLASGSRTPRAHVLMAILVISSFMLMPEQSLTALGLEIAAVGVLLFFVGSGMEIYALRKVNLQNRRPFIGNLVLLEIGILTFIVGGVLLLFGIESGFYCIAAGVIV